MNIDVESATLIRDLLAALDDLRERYEWFALEGEILYESTPEGANQPIYRVFYSRNNNSHIVTDLEA